MLYYVDRESKETLEEKIYGKWPLRFLYGSFYGSFFWLGKIFLPIITTIKFFSRLYGRIQKTHWSRRKIASFIKDYNIDPDEFLESPLSFHSFNDFFTRKLRPDARPISRSRAVMPADGRYLFFPNIQKSSKFYVKGQKLNLEQLLKDQTLAREYAEGALIFSRLCPSDYHRFHFPCDCIPATPTLINGPLKSVNPIALKKNLAILSENKRMITQLQTKHFGRVLCIEIGATNVGSIIQTYKPGKSYSKGSEKGFFEFGGSSLILIFPKDSLILEPDLATPDGIEIFCKMGTALGNPS